MWLPVCKVNVFKLTASPSVSLNDKVTNVEPEVASLVSRDGELGVKVISGAVFIATLIIISSLPELLYWSLKDIEELILLPAAFV